MNIEFDLIIASGKNPVDMKSALKTMSGISDGMRRISETVIKEEAHTALSNKSKVTTKLMESFTGSYGQKFSIDISGEKNIKRFQEIGEAVFVELISFFINEASYADQPLKTSEAALIAIDSLGDDVETLVKSLRNTPLKDGHAITTSFNYDVHIRHRTAQGAKEIARFNDATAGFLLAKKNKTAVDLEVVITRFNTQTGNGRMNTKTDSRIVAFGFNTLYKNVEYSWKKKVSRNLDQNNGKEPEDCLYLNISAYPVELKDGRVIKYLIKGIHEDK